MKLFILIAVSFFTGFCASAQSINLNLRQVPPEKVLKEIQEQTLYRFVYTKEQLASLPVVSIRVRNASLDDVLRVCFAKQPIEWEVEGNVVVLKRKENAATEVEAHQFVGRVMNELNEPMPSVSVLHLSTKQQTVTDANGYFSITGRRSDELEFTYVGYEKMRSVLGDDLLAVMRPSLNLLDETVVIAYGTSTREKNTGSVVTVKAKEIERNPVTNPLAALQGRVAGLQVSQQGGLPGSPFTILIRGRNSIQNGVSPLVIIDGVPFLGPNENLMQRGGFAANNPFSSIDPKNIERIEVLKDADATAIYGSRGANGVILITTKKASRKGSRLNVGVYHSFGKETRVLEYMGLQDYLAMRREAFKNDGVAMTNSNAPDLLLWDTTRNINWRKEIMGRTVHMLNANINYEAGKDEVKFALRSNYNRQGTVFPGDFGSEGANLSMSGSYSAKSGKLNLEFGSGYAYQNSLLPLNNMGQYLQTPPHAMDIYDSTGAYNWTEGGASFVNPMALFEQQHRGITERFSVNQRLRWQVSKGFQFVLTSGLNSVWFDEMTITPIKSLRPGTNVTGNSNFGNNQIQNWSIEPQMEYSGSVIKGVSFQLLAGGSLQASKGKSAVLSGSGYTNDALIRSIGGAAAVSGRTELNEYRYRALFARLNLSIKDEWLMNVTGRRDASSRFAPAKRNANFGAVGAAWIFSKRPVLSGSKLLSFGKLRGSYGITGNDQINNYQYLDSWMAGLDPYQGTAVIKPNKLFNPNYSWEQIRKTEAGIELGFLNNSIFSTVNFFRSRSDNQIVNYPLPSQTGFSSILKNFPGVVENKGWELMLESVNIERKNFRWTSSFNISFSKNKLIDFPLLEQSSYATTLIIGKPLNSVIGYAYSGIDSLKGVYTFKDQNNDGVYDQNDKVWTGTTDPLYYGGLTNSVAWKGFELSFLFEFKKQEGNHPFLSSLTMAGRMANVPVAMTNHWKEGSGGLYQKYTQQTSSDAGKAIRLMNESSAMLTDASYVRLKNIHLGYKLPLRIISKARMRSAEIYLQGQNLLTLTDYLGADPENQGLGGTSPLRQVVAGLNIQF